MGEGRGGHQPSHKAEEKKDNEEIRLRKNFTKRNCTRINEENSKGIL